MKKTIILFAVSLIWITQIILFAQDQADTSYWKAQWQGNLSFSQASFTNWAAGGENNLAINAFFKHFNAYQKEKNTFDYGLDFGYGLNKIGDQDFQKTDDKIHLFANYGRIISTNEKLLVSALFDFKSQFDAGYASIKDSIPISKFMAPAYVLLALGLDYRPVKYFQINFSPVTAKLTLVLDQRLADSGAFGVEHAILDDNQQVITPGKTSRWEIGTFMKFSFNKELVTNVNFQSKLELFTNYLENFGNIDVNWDNALVFKVNEWLAANLTVQLIYDDDILVPLFDDNDVQIGSGPRLQVKQVFGMGLNFQINP